MGSKQALKVNPERQRQRYTQEFKLEAVRLLDIVVCTEPDADHVHVQTRITCAE